MIQKKTFVKSLEYGESPIKFFLIDTSNGRGKLLSTPLYFTTKGQVSPNGFFNFLLNIDRKPYGVTINFVPNERGMYYIELIPQAGRIRINRDYEAGLYVNFAVPNKHLNIAAPFLGGQPWLDNAAMLNLQGRGQYVFRVK